MDFLKYSRELFEGFFDFFTTTFFVTSIFSVFSTFFRVWFLFSRDKTLSCRAVFFGRKKFKKSSILALEITQNKPCKCSRENCFIPVQLKANHACENEFGARKKKSKICPSKRLRFKKILKVLNFNHETVFSTRRKIQESAREENLRPRKKWNVPLNVSVKSVAKKLK